MANILQLAASKPSLEPLTGGRIAAIDLVRGVAVTLMILNHGVKGLLPFEAFPDWGLVPVHMATRFASSLFIIVFGIGLAVAFLPRTHTTAWPQKRLKLLLTGVVIYFWYKVLTIFEMLPYENEQILSALLYRSFPSFSEILHFFALALFWVPFFLPLWGRMPLWLRAMSPALLGLFSFWLSRNFSFWEVEQLQALLVEHEDHYCWGQLSRGPLILLGLLIGELIARYYHEPTARIRLVAWLALASVLLFSLFIGFSWPDLQQELRAIAYNAGKHPPELLFMLFSLGGAMGILALALWGGERLAKALRPITLIGSDSLRAFVFHIFVIFVIYRYLLGFWHDITYQHALIFTLCLILATALWIKINVWIQARA